MEYYFSQVVFDLIYECVWEIFAYERALMKRFRQVYQSRGAVRICGFLLYAFEEKQRNSTDLAEVARRAPPLCHHEFQQNDVWIGVLQFMIQA